MASTAESRILPSTDRRYAGVRPFGDTAADREIFRGRAGEVKRLHELVMAERVVTVFSRSGLGKSSLLNAGLAERLRRERLFPITGRIAPYAAGLHNASDVRGYVRSSLLQLVAEKARNTGVEFIRGQGDSLLDVFRASELWQEDELLVPVFVFDQFEEVFTLLSPVQRKTIVEELALLAGHSNGRVAFDRRLRFDTRVVFALREDYLAELEEVARDIPSILSTRFRLGGLTVEQAREAIIEPAKLDSPRFRCPPFEWSESAVSAVLTVLAASTELRESSTIEPFQLQLVCQYAENLIIRAHQTGARKRSIEHLDIAAAGKLTDILSGFYAATVRQVARSIDVAGAYAREARLRKLCEIGLITDSGRRRLLEESDVSTRFETNPHELAEMVEARLLRSETRGDTRYYELTHDSLLLPIRQSRDRDQRRKRTRWLATGATIGVFLVLLVGTFLWRTMRTELEQAKNETRLLKERRHADLLEAGKRTNRAQHVAEQLMGLEMRSELGRSSGKWVARLWVDGEVPDLLESVHYVLQEGTRDPIRTTERDKSFCAVFDIDAEIAQKRCPVVQVELHAVMGGVATRPIRSCQTSEMAWSSIVPTEYFQVAVTSAPESESAVEKLRSQGLDARVYRAVPRSGQDSEFAIALGPVSYDVERLKRSWRRHSELLSGSGLRGTRPSVKIVAGSRYVEQVYPRPKCDPPQPQ